MFRHSSEPHLKILTYGELRKLFVKYMDHVSLQEGDFHLDVPDLSEEEMSALEDLTKEVIMSSIEDSEI